MKFEKLRKLTINAAIIGIVLSAISSLFSYLRNWILSSAFSAEEFGIYIYILTLIGWMMTLCLSGLNTALLSYLINTKNNSNYKLVVGWVLGRSIKHGVLGAIILIVTFPLFIDNSTKAILFLYISLAISIPFSIGIYILNSTLIYQGKIIFNNAINVLVLNGATTVMIGILYLVNLNFYSLSLVSVAPLLIIYFYLKGITKCYIIYNDNIIEKETKRLITKSSLLILFSTLLYSFWIKAEIFFLNKWCGSECIPLYFVPFQYAFLLTIINTILFNIATSKINLMRRTERSLNCIYNRTAIFGLIINIPLFLLIYINSNELLKLFGSQYTNTESLVSIKILSIAFLLYGYLASTSEVFFNMLNGQSIFLKSSLISFFTSILANIIFTINFGVIGASISLSITILVTIYIRSYMANRQLKLKIMINYKIISSIIIIIIFIECFDLYFRDINDRIFRIIILNSILITASFLIYKIFKTTLNKYIYYFGLIKYKNSI
jgi:O-antigen/teichoic acid export membrane protein